MRPLRDELAPRILPVVLANITTRYPYHDAHLMERGEIPQDPTAVHPAFGNSFDWHSSVHSHWTAVQLLNHFAAIESADGGELIALRAAVLANLDSPHIAVESAYLAAHPSYERPYGWAWAMLLASTVGEATDATVRERAASLTHMATAISDVVLSWLAIPREPIRHGVHSNTAFALALMLDAARALQFVAFERAVADCAVRWFGGDCEWAEQWERSGNDFLSPGLAEADLMRRILPSAAFASWWKNFLPTLSAQSRILAVVDVPDVADGQIVHLHGLNLSRSGMLARIAHELQAADLLEQAQRLFDAAIDPAVSGNYLATHWLATFAWDAATSIDRARFI